ncbi:flagellar export chaperone FliS [Hathewaya histolytica]|uniref:Flagellar secretion chaperone FliS n=1 Tax=Hathewaya histolytica TaxID=1498 RepID=A0A4U9R800_HATHI|nr:flagellar export chaperone FliS [Hathewaya histolytica]VTQ87625.1 flagellar protein fliS [Hathewaya histolytica]
MTYANAYNTYKNNSINYASKEQLLLMLVDGAVKFSKISREGILENDFEKANTNIIKTQNIFYELMTSLDTNLGGEWAKNLYSIYEFIVQNLINANIKKDIEILNETIPLIENVKEIWYEAYKVSKVAK